MDLMELMVRIKADNSDANSKIEDTGNKASSLSSKLGSGLATAGKVGAAAVVAVGTATAAMTSALVKGVSQTAAYGDNIDKMSQKMGMSAQAYQEWDFIMQHNGTSMETLKSSMKTLANAVDSGNDAFGRLGISQEQIASMDNEQLFDATIAALQNVDDETERTYLAGQLLGRGATELGPLLNMTAEETDAMRQQVHDLGGVMSDEAVKASAAFQDSLQNMQVSFSGLKNSLMSEFMPSMTTVMDGLSAVFSGDSGSGLGLINEGISGFVGKLSETIPQVLEVGGQIITSLLTAITSNLPQLLQAGVDVIMQLVQGIIQNLPGLVSAAVEIITMLVSSIGENISMITSAAVEVILALVQGISENLPTLIPAIVEIVVQITTTLIENLPLLVEAGLQLIGGLIQGIVNAIPNLIQGILQAAQALLQAILGFFGIHSPSTVMQDVGTNLIQGLINGITNMISAVSTAITNVCNTIKNVLSKAWSNIKSTASTAWNGIKSTVTNIASNLASTISTKWESMKSKASTTWSTVKTNVSTAWSGIKSSISTAASSVYSTVSTKFESIKSAMSSKMESAKSAVSNVISGIKGLFNFSWSLPHLALPHFSFSGRFSLNPPSVPHLSVSWYKKAMDNAYLLNGATIFGSMGNKLLGGGEAGSEMVVGTDTLMNMISKASGNDITINVYASPNHDERRIAQEVERVLSAQITRRRAGSLA